MAATVGRRNHPEGMMKKTLLTVTLLAAAASVQAGPMAQLESASPADVADIAVAEVPAPVKAAEKGIFDDILDQIPAERTYRLGPLFKMEADGSLPVVVKNFEDAGAKIKESRVEGGWRDSYIVVVYKARFKVKQYRRDNISNPLTAYLLKDRITSKLVEQGVKIIYIRVEGLLGASSIILDYTGGKGDIPKMIEEVITGSPV